MTQVRPTRLSGEGIDVSALLCLGERHRALLTLAHGAGAGMDHPHLERLAARLDEQGIGTLRFQFPYREAGGRRPDRPPLLERTVRLAARRAGELAEGRRILAAGRSMGARMTARAEAERPLGVSGLIFFAFPLHRGLAAREPDPGLERARHLAEVRVPMLFLAGSRDRLARPHLLEGVVADLPGDATLHMVDTADHSFVPTRRSGRSPEQVEEELAVTTRRWIDGLG